MKYLVFHIICELNEVECFVFDTEWEREDFMYKLTEEFSDVDQHFIYYQKDWTIDGKKGALSLIYDSHGCSCGSPAIGQAFVDLPEVFDEFVEGIWEDI